MFPKFRENIQSFDPLLLLFSCIILGAGLVTMKTIGSSNYLFVRQLAWAALSLCVMFGVSTIDIRLLRKSTVVMTLYGASVLLLLALFMLGFTANGAQSWFSIASVSFQPSDMTKLALVLVLAKYFSRRHAEIADFKHVVISGGYAFLPFVLIALQPDFGSAIIIFFIWFGMVLVAGISKKQLFIILAVGLVAFCGLWFFVFKTYQKERIMTFIHPLADLHGTGYNAYQSVVAVGSGQLLGKGVGYGTQSRLQFLPEYETDFIFAAFSEEWGFIGSSLLLVAFFLLVVRILTIASRGASNFETLACVGIALHLISHVVINVGMNIGVMPVTGITLPFMSYGGSHLLTESLALGIVMAMARYQRIGTRTVAPSSITDIV